MAETVAFKKTLLHQDYYKKLDQRMEFEGRFTKLLEETKDKKHPIGVCLQSRLLKYKQHIFTFLYYHPVPPDNNGSEQAISYVKVK